MSLLCDESIDGREIFGAVLLLKIKAKRIFFQI
jgi:hypothetical protein